MSIKLKFSQLEMPKREQEREGKCDLCEGNDPNCPMCGKEKDNANKPAPQKTAKKPMGIPSKTKEVIPPQEVIGGY